MSGMSNEELESALIAEFGTTNVVTAARLIEEMTGTPFCFVAQTMLSAGRASFDAFVGGSAVRHG